MYTGSPSFCTYYYHVHDSLLVYIAFPFPEVSMLLC